MIRIAAGVLAASMLAAGCGAGGASRVTVDSPAPPPQTDSVRTEPEDAPGAQTVEPEPAAEGREAAATPDTAMAMPDTAASATPASAVPTTTGDDLPDLAATPGGLNYPPAVRIGAQVDDVRTDPGEIIVEVGDSLASDEDYSVVAYDDAGEPVRGVRILSSIDSRFAIVEEGFIKGLEEGEAELRMAIRVPPASGTGPPEIRTFTAPVRVVGAPVVALEIEEPGVRFLTGSVVQLHARALADDGSVRETVEVTWTSNRRRLATVDAHGFVRGIRPGDAVITAVVEGIEATFALTVEEDPVASVEVSGASRARTGDVIRFSAVARDAEGAEVGDVAVDFTVSSFQERADMGASVYPDGAFVAERPGIYRIAATVGGSTGQAFIEVVERGVEHEVMVVGRGTGGEHPTSDLWAFTGVDGRDYVYTGTHLGGQRMLAWDVTDPANPILTDYVEVDARVVNDVKVNSRGTVAVMTREGASDRRNGIVVLDLADPAHPVVADTYTDELTGGVHNVFFSGDILYAIHNGTFDVHILDLTDPTDVEEVGRWGIESRGKYLHDIWVLDGMAYVSYWNDGVYILDAGDGRWGGTPTQPVEVSHLAYPEGNTHFAYPYTNADGHRYLFVGDEIFDCEECISRNGVPGDGSRGFVHVIDLEDPESLREVARYEVPEAGAHNLWIEDDRMYVAYYQAGLRVVDVSGELRGDLYRQGREMAWLPTGSPAARVPNSPMAWGPQPFKGHIFVSDMHSGLWVVRIEPKNRAPVS